MALAALSMESSAHFYLSCPLLLNNSNSHSSYSAISSQHNTSRLLKYRDMSLAKKRKLNNASEVEEGASVGEALEADFFETKTTENPSEAAKSPNLVTDPEPIDKNKERQERFKALQARAASFSPTGCLITDQLTLLNSKNLPKRTSKKQQPNPSA